MWPHFSKQASMWRSSLKGLKTFLPYREAVIVQELLNGTPPTIVSSLCFCSQVGFCCVGGRIAFFLGHDLKTVMVSEPARTHPAESNPPCSQLLLTGSKRDPLLGGNESLELFSEGCRCQLQEARWGPGSGTQNGSGASVHLLSVSPKHTNEE